MRIMQIMQWMLILLRAKKKQTTLDLLLLQNK